MTDFDRIKDALPLSTLVEHYGSKMQKRFANPAPCCQHEDCCSIQDAKAHWKCFSCNQNGDVFDMIMVVENIDKAEALKRAADLAGITLEPFRQHAPKPRPAESAQAKMFRLAAEYYHLTMAKDAPDGRKWFCGKRGHSEATLAAMQVGWSDGRLLAHLVGQGFTAADVVKAGLAADRNAKDEPIPPRDYFWKAGLAIFPVCDHEGAVITFTCKDPEKQVKDLQLAGIQKKWFLNHAALGRGTELWVVEGQNDIASLTDAGVNNVVGTAGGPGKEQVTLLKNFCSGKTVYLWFDKDPDKNPTKNEGGPAHTRLLYNGLKDSGVTVRIINHPGAAKDPDEFIQGILKKDGVAGARKALRDLRDTAMEPLAWEIEQLRLIADARDRLATLKDRKIPQAINAVSVLAERETYIDALAKACGISVKAIEDLLENCSDLYSGISQAFGGVEGIKKADPLQLAECIFKWFSGAAGARFFKTGDGKVWLFYHGRIFEIGNNLEFNTLMLRLTRLAAVEKPGSLVWYYLANLCNLHGEPVSMMSWLFTDRERDSVYLNFSLPHNKILQISPDKAEVIDNGTNEHSVLLSSSPQIHPFHFHQEASEAEGLTALKTLLMDTTPCEGPQRYFMVCWVISVFMMNYQSDRGLLQIIGQSGLGKSKVAERISQLLYGENFVGSGTSAADTRVAVQNPVIFIDNLENRDLVKGKVDFLLFLANSANRPKAETGSDTGVVYQKLNSMGIITAIEPFPGRLPELINRTFPLILDQHYRQHGYMHDEVMRRIAKERAGILSALFRLLSRGVLPRLAERVEWSKFIQTRYPGHNKERNNEHICTMMVILEALLEHLPVHRDKPIKFQAQELLDRWITYQEEQSTQTAVTSNTLLVLMDGLAKEVLIKMRGKTDLRFDDHPDFDGKVKVYDDPEYLETFYLTEPKEEESEDEFEFMEQVQRLEMIVTAADLYTIFNRYCANQHVRNPFDSPTALGARITNDRDIMYKGGWEFISRKEGQSQYKKIHGKWYWRFSRKIKGGKA